MRWARLSDGSRKAMCSVALVVWSATVALGLSRLWSFERSVGAAASAPMVWPAGAPIQLNESVSTLVVLMHPRCPCSRATLGELARIMTRCQGKLEAIVWMIRPAEMEAGWEKTDLWRTAEAIPGVRVVSDEDGAVSRRFGSLTSGQCLLYGTGGKLLFAGGITVSRGHNGDNDGESAVVALVRDGERAGVAVSAPVYGCPLFDGGTEKIAEPRAAGSGEEAG